MELLKYNKLIYLLLCVFISCKTSNLYDRADNSSDNEGIRRSIVVYRLFIDGKPQERKFASYYNSSLKTPINYHKILYNDLTFETINSFSESHGQKSGYDGNQIIIVNNDKAMTLTFSEGMIGKNIYIDSLPFVNDERLYMSSSIKLGEIVSLKKKYSISKRWKKPDDLVKKPYEVEFRKFFALTEKKEESPIDDLFKKNFYSVKFNDLKNKKI